MKNYTLTLEYVLYEMSYVNATLLNSVIPTDSDKSENEFNEELDANVAGRFNNGDDNEVVVRR